MKLLTAVIPAGLPVFQDGSFRLARIFSCADITGYAYLSGAAGFAGLQERALISRTEDWHRWVKQASLVGTTNGNERPIRFEERHRLTFERHGILVVEHKP